MLKRFIHGKASLLALNAALLISVLLGCFLNTSTKVESFHPKQWYYINRGYPVAWAGISLENTRLDFPLVKLPFLAQKIESEKGLSKIVDIGRLFPLLVALFIISYVPSIVFAKAVDENKNLTAFYLLLNVAILLGFFYVYFSLFPRT